jgi:hypothetical protein
MRWSFSLVRLEKRRRHLIVLGLLSAAFLGLAAFNFSHVFLEPAKAAYCDLVANNDPPMPPNPDKRPPYRPNWTWASQIPIQPVADLARAGFFEPVIYLVVVLVSAALGRMLVNPDRVYQRKPHQVPTGGSRAVPHDELLEVQVDGMPEVQLGRERPKAVASATLVQGFAVAFLIFPVILLAYETYGVSTHNISWTLTWFVRCINASNSWGTMLALIPISFVFGMWFLFPARPEPWSKQQQSRQS